MPVVGGLVAATIATEVFAASAFVAGLVSLGTEAALAFGWAKLVEQDEKDDPTNPGFRQLLRGLEQNLQQTVPFKRVVFGNPVIDENIFGFLGVSTQGSIPHPDVQHINESGALLDWLLLIAANRCDGLDWIEVDGTRVNPDAGGFATSPDFILNDLPFLRVSFREGLANQLMDRIIRQDFPELPDSFRQLDTATLAMQYFHGEDPQQFRDLWGGSTRNVRMRVRGARVWDPRDFRQSKYDPETWTYSNNAALVLAWLMRNPLLIPGVTYDDFDTLKLAYAADVCDIGFPTLDGRIIPRYTLDGSISTDTAPRVWIRDCLRSMFGRYTIEEGLIVLKPGEPVEPQFSISEMDILGGFEFPTAHPSSDHVSVMTARCIVEEEESFQLQALPQTYDVPPEEQTHQYHGAITFPYTYDASRGQMLTRIAFERRKRAKLVQLLTRVPGYVLKPTDVTAFGTRNYQGLLDGHYEVTGLELRQPELFNIDLRQYDNGIWYWDPEIHEKPIDTTTFKQEDA